MRNKAYANTLKALARNGADAFYFGPIAEDIAAAVQGDLNIPGDMTVDDLANYEVVERAPVCIDYRGKNVCGMGPPSSGALAVEQILGIPESVGHRQAAGRADLQRIEEPANAGVRASELLLKDAIQFQCVQSLDLQLICP